MITSFDLPKSSPVQTQCHTQSCHSRLHVIVGIQHEIVVDSLLHRIRVFQIDVRHIHQLDIEHQIFGVITFVDLQGCISQKVVTTPGLSLLLDDLLTNLREFLFLSHFSFTSLPSDKSESNQLFSYNFLYIALYKKTLW